MNVQTFYSNGKLLLTAEYAILDGAKGLAVPTKFGQSLKVSKLDSKVLRWTSLDEKDNIWFTAEYYLPTLNLRNTTNDKKAKKLIQLLEAALKLNPEFLEDSPGFEVETKLGFSPKWGLGSSSTLINNMAQWANVNAHQLLWNSFGGSGYDISCAQHDTPILYQLDLGHPIVEQIDFNPPFRDKLFFVHLNKKQDSGKAIENYREQHFNKNDLITTVNSMTDRMLAANTIEVFESLLIEHELVLSKVLGIKPIKERFTDYFGAIKSLGAWGGDFILATGNEKTPDYFKAKGFDTVLTYKEMVL